MAQTTFEAPNAPYPDQLENDLRRTNVSPQGLQVYGRNGGSFVLYSRELTAQERSTVQARIDAHAPDHSERDALIAYRNVLRQLKQARANWGPLTLVQLQAVVRDLVDVTLYEARKDMNGG